MILMINSLTQQKKKKSLVTYEKIVEPAHSLRDIIYYIMCDDLNLITNYEIISEAHRLLKE